MLPGFRFLFTAIVLSMSVLIFGLGAAALLRAAHEEFANLPVATGAARADVCPPERRPAADAGAAARRSAGHCGEADGECSGRRGPGTASHPDIPAPAEPEKLAALKPAEEPVQVEAAKPENPAKEASAETRPRRPAATTTEAPVANAEVKIAAIAATPEPAAATPPATSPEPSADIPSFEGSIATTLIATLGGPAVIIDEKTTPDAKPDRSVLRKRAAQRARERRRMIAARRARLAREAVLTLQAAAAQPVCAAAAAGRPRQALASGCTDQAGPVATGGPSAAPHSVHEPSYSAGFSTPRR